MSKAVCLTGMPEHEYIFISMTLPRKLFRPVDNSPLIVFRIVFGLLIFLEAWGAILTGWVDRAFIQPAYTFPFLNFSWLQPLPGYGMYIYYVIMGLAGLMVMVGFFYRLGIGIYTIMWTGVYLMQKTHYNNHYYLLVLLCLFMCIVPANKYASLDVKRNPDIKSLTCPQWCLWIFALQIAIVYFYAAVAKMYPDWLAAKPIEIWFKYKSDYFIIGPLLKQPWFQYAVVYGGIFFDLLIVPALLWKKTRKYALIIAVIFHLFNSVVFQVGVFPYMALAMSVFFFDPEVIRRNFFSRKPKPFINFNYKSSPVLVYTFLAFFIVQLVLPLRHWFYPGSVNWTEEGHRLSWRMMLRTKSGHVIFKVKDRDQERSINPYDYLTYKQAHAVAVRPDLCWQFVQILKMKYSSMGHPHVEIYAESNVSLNGQKRQPLYDNTVDLADIKWKSFEHACWLLPLKEEDRRDTQKD